MNVLDKHISRAAQLFDLKRYKECISEIKKALSLEPTHAEALSILVNASALGENPQETMIIGQEALKHHPRESAIYFGLGLARMRLGFYSQAEEEFRIAIQLSPFESASFINLAISLKKQDKWNAAELAINKALELYPNSDLALNIKAQIRQKNNAKGFEESISEAMRIAPDNGYHHKIKAKHCFENKDFVQAAFHYQQAVKLNPLDSFLRNEFLRSLQRTHPTFRFFTKYYPFGDANIGKRISVLLAFILLTLFLKSTNLFTPVSFFLWLPFFVLLATYWFGVPFSRQQLSKRYFKRSDYATANFHLPLQTLAQISLIGLLGLIFTDLLSFKVLSICAVIAAYCYAFTREIYQGEMSKMYDEKPWKMTAFWVGIALLIPFFLLFQNEQVPTEGVI